MLPDDNIMKRTTSRVEGPGEFSHSSLAETLFEEFSALPKKAKTDLDDYAVINVGPSVVPNPYLPTFRVFAYNATGGSGDDVETHGDTEVQFMKKKGGRDHGHKHPGKHADVDCKKKENRGTWACRPRKPQYASEDAPSRRNTQWTPLGYAQVRTPAPPLIFSF